MAYVKLGEKLTRVQVANLITTRSVGMNYYFGGTGETCSSAMNEKCKFENKELW